MCVHIHQCKRVQRPHWSGVSDVYEGAGGHSNRCDALYLSFFLWMLFLISSSSSDRASIMTPLICDTADGERWTTEGKDGGRRGRGSWLTEAQVKPLAGAWVNQQNMKTIPEVWEVHAFISIMWNGSSLQCRIGATRSHDNCFLNRWVDEDQSLCRRRESNI